jgi:hypothetical protein
MDCYYAQSDTTWAQSFTPGELVRAQAHCKSYRRLTKCPSILHRQMRATGCSLIAVFFTAGLVTLPICNDADEVCTDKKILIARIAMITDNQPRQVVLYLLAWWGMLLRKWLLPSLVAAEVIAQTLTNPITVQQVLLNGLSVCFITEVDNVLWHYVLPWRAEKMISSIEGIEQSWLNGDPFTPNGQHSLHYVGFSHEGLNTNEPWVFSRMYAVSLALVIIYICVFPFESSDNSSALFTWGYAESNAFPFSDVMTLCDKTSAICFRCVHFALLAAVLAGCPQLISRVWEQRPIRYYGDSADEREVWGHETKETSTNAASVYHVVVELAGLFCRVMVLFISFIMLKWSADALYRTGFGWQS